MADVLPFQPKRTTTPVRDNRATTRERAPEPLWREVLGRRLRAVREEQGGRLVDIAARAGMSPQYLSEIERGRKEPSSEMIAAVTGALGLELADLLAGIASTVQRRADAGRAEVGHADAGRADAGRAEVGRADAGRAGMERALAGCSDTGSAVTERAVGRGRPAGPVLLAA